MKEKIILALIALFLCSVGIFMINPYLFHTNEAIRATAIVGMGGALITIGAIYFSIFMYYILKK